MAEGRSRLSSVIPPLLCGTATFNSQYNADPHALATTEIVHRALALGIRGFDTSPYYGPAEELLGTALATGYAKDTFQRSQYFLATKAGRVAAEEFDFSPEWIRSSVQRSLERLRTPYVDLVYCHDVEFVSPPEVLAAVRELRRLRDDAGVLRYVGISGYPVDTLCELAELVLRETGEPLDAVMSYANFTLQNTRLRSVGVPRLLGAAGDAGVVVPNASPLGMGLLRRVGVPVGGQGDFHPAANGLREACRRASRFCDARGAKLEEVALRFALEGWLREGAAVGSRAVTVTASGSSDEGLDDDRAVGVSVIGVSTVDELENTVKIWNSLLNTSRGRPQTPTAALDSPPKDNDAGLGGGKGYQELYAGVRAELGSWIDFAWPSPGPNYVRTRSLHTPRAVEASGQAQIAPKDDPREAGS